MRRNTLRCLVSVSAVATCLLATGCGASTAANPSSQEGPRIAVFLPALANSYTAGEISGMEKAFGEAGAEVDFMGADYDGARQLAQIQDAVTSGRYSGFIVQPSDSVAVVPGVRQAAAADIPVVAAYLPVGSDLTTGDPQVDGVISTVWYPTPEVGPALAEMTKAACERDHSDSAPCQVILLTGGNTVTLEQIRIRDFEASIADSDIEVVAIGEGMFDSAVSRDVATDLILANPNVDVIVSGSDAMTAGAEQALDAAGVDGVSLIGGGASLEGVEAVDDGRWFGTVLEAPFDAGQIYARTILDIVAGKHVDKVIGVREHLGLPIAHTADSEMFRPQWSAVGAVIDYAGN
ncbi:sugar ABC transporter substrate-binding protein [Salinibacterium sp. ZJ454]|uniref:sugar ABC transporter substrate-binding protein n=1 Tax=Salinibacterium sp. ZJ454 TaxID=2708339 RepID=UPI002443E4D3|nr:sugar ABC transporter substrate-binding protein [Salinibacterium sp. ZJ454]